MFTELAFIDWIALAFAAVLLAGAAAAAVLAYATSRARTSEPRSGYAHAASASTTAETMAKTKTEPAHASARVADNVVDLNDHRPIHAAAEEPQHVAEPAEVEVDAGSAPSLFEQGSSIPLSTNSLARDDEGNLRDPIVLPAADSAQHVASDDTVDLRTAMPTPAVSDVDDSALSAKLATRAAKLRGRPESEQPKTADAFATRTIEMAPGEVLTTAPQAESTAGSRIGFGARVPGFFEDPMGRHELRYWDGNRWTEYVKERGERFTDPL